jgi:hypothetical protein
VVSTQSTTRYATHVFFFFFFFLDLKIHLLRNGIAKLSKGFSSVLFHPDNLLVCFPIEMNKKKTISNSFFTHFTRITDLI